MFMKSQELLGLTIGGFTINPLCVEQVKRITENILKMKRVRRGKTNEEIYAPFALMIQGNDQTSVIDHWNRHLLWAS